MTGGRTHIDIYLELAPAGHTCTQHLRMRIEENIPLAQYTTLKVGGPARFFCVAQTVEDVKEAVGFAKEKNAPIFVLGGGSNVLVSDDGFDGLVIKMEVDSITHEVDNSSVLVTAGAGVEWDELVAYTCTNEWYGLENLSLIPGTVGASVVQNIGAYGVEVAEKVFYVEVFDTERNETKKMLRDECSFGYRQSIFKTDAGEALIVLSVTYELSLKKEVNCAYADVQEYFNTKKITVPSIQDVRRAIVEIRERKLPDMQEYGTAGSFFKNPVVSTAVADELKENYPDIKLLDVGDGHFKVSAAWLLDQFTDWKGNIINGVGGYEKHALVLVTTEDATEAEVTKRVCDVQKKVFIKTKLQLEPEVVFVKNKK